MLSYDENVIFPQLPAPPFAPRIRTECRAIRSVNGKADTANRGRILRNGKGGPPTRYDGRPASLYACIFPRPRYRHAIACPQRPPG